MQIRFVLVFATILFASACGGSKSSIADTEPTCGISQSLWHLGEISPPNRVLVWRVLAEPTGLQVNGEMLNEDLALTAISRTKAFRPSPYLILSRHRSVSCDRIRNLTERISRDFDCRANYCFLLQQEQR